MTRRRFILNAAGVLVPFAGPVVKAQYLPHRRKAFRSTGSPPVSYYLSEDFEGTGVPSGFSMSYVSGSSDFEYSTSPAPLDGSESWKLYGRSTSNEDRAVISLGGTRSVVWVYLKINPSAVGTGRAILFFNSSSGQAGLAGIGAGTPSNTMAACRYTQSNGGTAIWQANQTHHLWASYTQGSTSTVNVYVSTTATRPSVTHTASASFNYGISDIYIMNGLSSLGNGIIDKVRIAFEEIGSDPT